MTANTAKTRLIKCWCGDCGYTMRVTKKWIFTTIPICPTCKINLNHELERFEPLPNQLTLIEGQRDRPKNS